MRYLVAVVVAMVAWCGVPPRGSTGNGEVAVKLFQYQPGALNVHTGTRVVWSNQDEIEHTVTAGTPEQRGDRFDARLEGKGASTAITFTEPGIYPYFCERHPHMRGEIRVN